jgi:hypothetical protein
MVAVVALLSGRELGAGVALAGAIATKLSAALLAPFALLGASQQPRPTGRKRSYTDQNRPVGRVILGGVVVVVAIGGAAWLAFGWDWLHGFGLAGENQSRTSYMSIPIAAAVACLLAWTYRGGDWLRAAAWANLALLLATAWLLPWYLLWLLPLAAVSRDRPLQLLSLALTAYQLGARIPL